MKKYISILIFSCFTLCSCENFLDLAPQSVLTPDNAYTKPDDWQQTLYAAYGSLQEVFVGKYTITLGEFGTDEVTWDGQLIHNCIIIPSPLLMSS